MGNCCASPPGPRTPKQQRPNPYEISALHTAGTLQLSVLGHLWQTLSIQVQDNILEKYVLGKELGRGEFGITYHCTDRVSNEVFACKSISKRKLRTAVDIEDVRREAIIMHQLPPHPNIVSLKGLYEDDNAVHLVMEFCEGGELFDRIVARGHYNERATASITRTIVEVVQACHKNGVMHRDLKPENFLFANKRENSPLKAIDFGLSVFFKPGEKFSEIVGSPYYMAPEILKRNYGPEVDIWSAGVILYILLSGLPPFWAETEQGVAQAILRCVLNFRAEPWPKISDKAKSLVRQMLEPDPRKRLSPQQVLDHPWLQNMKHAPETSLGETVRSRLRQFSAMNKLRKKALRVIAELLSGDEVETIKTMFMTMDTQKRGYLSFDEFMMGLRKFGSQLTEAEIQHLMEDVGAQRNGYLDYGKFVALTIQLQRLDTDEYLRKAFDHFDIDGNGFIDINELTQSLKDDLGPDDHHLVRDIMQEVDVDKDGRISYEEFASMMQAGTDWRKFSRRYSRERFNNLSIKLMNDGSLQMHENGQMR